MNRKLWILNFTLACALVLAACNLPSGQNSGATIATSAAQTVEAAFSVTPNVTPSFTTAPEATATPFPTLAPSTNTPAATATSNCNVAQFIADVTIPDGTVLAPNANFTKKWRLKNAGSCAWNGFSLVFDSGEDMNGPASKPVAAVNPGQEIDLELNLTAPATVGSYRGYWRLVTNGSVLVPVINGYQGKSFYVDIKVQNAVTATFTNAPFAVTSVTFANTGGCNGFTTTASITVNGAGTVNFHWIRSDGATSAAPPALVFAAAGTQMVSTSWMTTASGSHGFDIYIDSPNHQQFGSATFTCP